MTLTQGLVFAGAALSLVGNITGNKTLSKIGMVAGIAGGVGMLAETITGSTFGGETRVGDLAGETVKNAPSQAATPLGNTPTETVAQTPAGTVADATQAVQGGPVASAGGTPVATADVSAPAPTPGAPLAAVDTVPAAPAQMPAATPPATSYDSFGSPAAPGSPAAIKADPTGLAQAQLDANAAQKLAVAGKPGLVSSVLDGIKGNPMAAYIAAQGVAGVGNYMSAKDERDYQAQLAAQRRARLNAGYQGVDQGMVVTPQMAVPVNPQQFAAQQIQPAGLIAARRA